MSGPGVLPIVECGDPVLRRPAEPVGRPIWQRRATAAHRPDAGHHGAAPGVGLAAPQVGVPIQLAVLHDGPERWGQLTEEERTRRQRNGLHFTVLVTALRLVDDRAQVSFYEGLPERSRAHRGRGPPPFRQVEALDEYGQLVDRVFSGWAAIVQHEVDHLAGRLYLDRVETRSLSSTGTYARLWAGGSPEEAAASSRSRCG